MKLRARMFACFTMSPGLLGLQPSLGPDLDYGGPPLLWALLTSGLASSGDPLVRPSLPPNSGSYVPCLEIAGRLPGSGLYWLNLGLACFGPHFLRAHFLLALFLSDVTSFGPPWLGDVLARSLPGSYPFSLGDFVTRGFAASGPRWLDVLLPRGFAATGLAGSGLAASGTSRFEVLNRGLAGASSLLATLTHYLWASKKKKYFDAYNQQYHIT